MSLIKIQNLKKVYKMGEESIYALNNISLEIQKNEFVSIMGASGSGKTTFLSIVGCLDQATEGEYYLDGILIKNLSKNQLAKIRNQKIGFVFQKFYLLPRLTALENVELPLVYANVPKKERIEKAKFYLSLVGLESRMHHFPNQLSGGQQQRVAIARALVNQAPILLADEPTGNLDSKTSNDIMELFVRLHRENHITIILVTHESNIAKFSERIIYFQDGKILKEKRL
ncbi:MAG: ABC transporter ATP-binding protein [Leptospiraceae bacterium]|jgi:putative ABC transport system ATP-binding protein|nr:ABC transporter ATP-binding protein [Leptospiraceae bacterium]